MPAACRRVSTLGQPGPPGVVRLHPSPPCVLPTSLHTPTANLSAWSPRFTTKKEKKICSSLTSPAVQKLIRSLEEKQKNPPPKPQGRSRRLKRKQA